MELAGVMFYLKVCGGLAIAGQCIIIWSKREGKTKSKAKVIK